MVYVRGAVNVRRLHQVSIHQAHTTFIALFHPRGLDPRRIALGQAGLLTALLTLIIAIDVAAPGDSGRFWSRT